MWTIIIVVIVIVFLFIALLSGSNNEKLKNNSNSISDKDLHDLLNLHKEVGEDLRKTKLMFTRKVMSITSELTEEGLKYHQEGNDNESIKSFEKCLEYPYPSWVAFYKLMDIYRKRKDYKNELRVIERSIEILHNDNMENGRISEYPIQPLIDRLSEVDNLISEANKTITVRNPISWTDEDQKELDDLREYNRKEGEILSKCSDTNNKGIAFEKDGSIDEALKLYEENITLKYPATHAYKRLMILYRKRKDYENELRVIRTAIDVFMQENERRANQVLEEHPEWEDVIMQAMETNEEVRLDDGRYVLNQYNVFEFIDRGEKVKRLVENKSKKSC